MHPRTLLSVASVALALVAVIAPAYASAGVRVEGLKTEYERNPLGIDERQPRLSWLLESDERGQVQTAYQVQVASSPSRLAAGDADVWDSGKVTSARSVNVAYGGPALESRARYSWRVRAWDKRGQPSAWSGPAWWEMGLLEASDWRAKWIGEPPPPEAIDLEGASWIWYPEGNPAQSAPVGTRHFRKVVDLPAKEVVRARIVITADDQFTLDVNGAEAARSSGAVDEWRDAKVVDVTEMLAPGANTLAVTAENTSVSPAGLIAKLEVDFSDGDRLVAVTDSSWEASIDESQWTAALEVAAYGDGPWGSQVSVPTGELDLGGANWIWYPEGNPASSAPAATRHFRRALDLPDKEISSARLLITADDQFTLYVNGSEAARSGGQTDAWREAQLVDLTDALSPGANTLTVRAVNTSVSPAGLIAKLEIEFQDGERLEVVTDDSWEASLDGSEWTAALELAAYGGGPWGTQVRLAEPFPGRQLRKDFAITKPVARARVYASALGLYELRINGEKVGDEVFAPGWTDYERRAQYQTYDITAMLRAGQNALGAVLGEGWFSGGIVWDRFTYGDQPRLTAQLEITYADGSRDVIASDGSWRWSDAPIVSSNIYDGETYDARLEQPGWDQPGFDDSSWEPAYVDGEVETERVAQVDPPLRATKTIRPVSVREPEDGTFIFDMGQNFAGWARLRVSGAEGTTVRLRFGEVLNPDGTLHTANLRGARATDTYVLKGGGVEVFEPRFTYHGFRYVEVTGYPGTPTRDSVAGRVVHSDTPESGSFATSNPLINKLQSNITWGQRSNFFSVPTDCPQRDERLGWMGDAQMFVGTSSFNMDVAGFFTKWMRDVEDAQRPGGAFTDVAPDVCCGAGTAGWGDAGVIVPWAIYERYGDARVIERHYDAMQRWIDYLEANSEGLLRPAEGYGDWLNAGQETPRDVIGTAFFAYSTDLVARMARVIGRDADAERYEGLRDRIKAAFNGAYVSDEGRIKGDTQTAYVLALHMDLLPEELRDAAAARLVELIEARGWHLSTGFLGTPHLLDVLTEAGYGDVAHRLLNQDTVPSWLYMVKNGATTIWERWDSILPDGSLNDPGLNSLNHYGFGSVGDWMYRRIGAIAPGGPGYEHVLVKPDPGGDLTEAKAKYQSIRGEIEVEWEAERDRFKLAVTIPANATATVSVPTADPASVTESGTPARQAEGVRLVGAEDGYAVYEVGSGKYAFEAKRGAPVR